MDVLCYTLGMEGSPSRKRILLRIASKSFFLLFPYFTMITVDKRNHLNTKSQHFKKYLIKPSNPCTKFCQFLSKYLVRKRLCLRPLQKSYKLFSRLKSNFSMLDNCILAFSIFYFFDNVMIFLRELEIQKMAPRLSQNLL